MAKTIRRRKPAPPRTARASASRASPGDGVAVQILNDLKEQIVTGALPRGAKLPTEKELSQQYAVSGPTIREAMRGLDAIGLIEVRHGSGAYVSADGGSLVTMSWGAFVQLEKVGVADALAILAVLNEHAASCAVKQATSADLRRIREAAEALSHVDDPQRAAAAGRAFHLHAALRSSRSKITRRRQLRCHVGVTARPARRLSVPYRLLILTEQAV